MKNYKTAAIALGLIALASCADKASIKGVVAGAPERDIVVRQLNINTFSTLDTVKTGKDGSFSYSLKVSDGQPEFVYLFLGDKRIAALLLEKGETARVEADTLGTYSVSGSEGSAKLQEVEKAYTDFVRGMAKTTDARTLGRVYVDHYRSSVKYIMENPFSLTTVPVLFEAVNNLPVFSQATDAILFRNAADSLDTVYPDSRYVKALRKEAERREKEMKLNLMLSGVEKKSYPVISAPDINGRSVSIDSLGAKAILVHFWDASNAAQKMLNIEVLKPVYDEFHAKGLEIYSVCVSPDKAEWAGVVKAQELPWVNVNDGLGTASPMISVYNLGEVPTTFLIADGEIVTEPASGKEGIRALLKKLL